MPGKHSSISSRSWKGRIRKYTYKKGRPGSAGSFHAKDEYLLQKNIEEGIDKQKV